MTNQNLPCPFCGCIMIDYLELHLKHPENGCLIAGRGYRRDIWNSRPPYPLQDKVRAFKEYLKIHLEDNSLNETESKKLLKNTFTVFIQIFGERE